MQLQDEKMKSHAGKKEKGWCRDEKRQGRQNRAKMCSPSTLREAVVEGSALGEWGMLVEMISLLPLSPLGELRVDEDGEFGWSLTSMPLSCWSPPLSNFMSAGTTTAACCDAGTLGCWPPFDVAWAKLIGFDHALIVGTGAGVIDREAIIEAALVLLVTIKEWLRSGEVRIDCS